MSTASAPVMREVAESVYAYVQPDGGWCLNNAGLVVGGDAALVVDTAATEQRSRALADAVHAVVPAGPHYLVNTHFHGDHTFGNGVFAPPAKILAHPSCHDEQLAAGLGLRELWPDVEWGATPIVPADITYRGSAAVRLGELRVDLLHHGPAHTTGDTVVWIPDRGVLFTGDIVWSGTTPFCLMGSISGSIDTVERLRTLEPEVVVPGHGPVGGDELFDATAAYLYWVTELATDGLRAGRTALETARAAELGEFADLLDAERLVGNLHRAYAELAPAGTAPDIMTAFSEMVQFHGGLPYCEA